MDHAFSTFGQRPLRPTRVTSGIGDLIDSVSIFAVLMTKPLFGGAASKPCKNIGRQSVFQFDARGGKGIGRIAHAHAVWRRA